MEDLWVCGKAPVGSLTQILTVGFSGTVIFTGADGVVMTRGRFRGGSSQLVARDAFVVSYVIKSLQRVGMAVGWTN